MTEAASAELVFDNGAPPSNYAVRSDANSVDRVADDFHFDVATSVEAIEFWGFYSPDNPPVEDDFTLKFYEDSSGLPGDTIGSATLLNGPGLIRSAAGIQGSHRRYHYTALVDPVLFAPGQTYWLSIFNNTTGMQPSDGWSWVGFLQSLGEVRLSAITNSQGVFTQRSSDFAFRMSGIAIPEPSTLLLASLAALAVVTRHQRLRVYTSVSKFLSS